MKHFLLDGEFVRLEPLTLDHLPDLESDFEPRIFDYYPKPYSTAREFVEENLELQGGGAFFPFAIVDKASGCAIGCTELSGVDKKNRKLEIGGSWIKPAHQGSVANSEAKFLLLCHAFENLGFVRVQFTANALNARSRCGIERIGGKFEGILRNAMILPDGTLRNDAYYSIISEAWPETKERLRQRIAGKVMADRTAISNPTTRSGAPEAMTSSTENFTLRRAVAGDEERFFEHLVRHFAESGDGDIIFQPTDAHQVWVKADFIEKVKAKWSKSLDQVGWEVAWILEKDDRFIGHVTLQSGRIETSLHRSQLGLGLEREARGQGLGRRLAQEAIEWAREQVQIDWIDLGVFEHNLPAWSLYRSLGFKKNGSVKDLFRVRGQSISDVQMCLAVNRPPRA